MVVQEQSGMYSCSFDNKQFNDFGLAKFWDTYCVYRNFVGSNFYNIKGEKYYIQDEYLYKVWLIYLSLLQCTIHFDLIKNYDVFVNSFNGLSDTFLDNQTSIPELFQRYKDNFKGPGWYSEDSNFGVLGDNINIVFESAKDIPIRPEIQSSIKYNMYKVL